MAQRIVSTGGFHDELQLRQVLKDRAAEELRRETEIEVFDAPGIIYAEYCRRKALYEGKGDTAYFINEELPQDEMDYHDYRLSRGDTR